MKIPGITAAKKLAKKSTRKHQHVALVYKGGALLSIGYNYNKIHAEVAALKKLWPVKRKGATVVSIRVGWNDRLKNAEPCPCCYKYMEEVGVRQVLWSNTAGVIRGSRRLL